MTFSSLKIPLVKKPPYGGASSMPFRWPFPVIRDLIIWNISPNRIANHNGAFIGKTLIEFGKYSFGIFVELLNIFRLRHLYFSCGSVVGTASMREKRSAVQTLTGGRPAKFDDPCDTCVLDDCELRSSRCNLRKSFNEAQRMRRKGFTVPSALKKLASEYHRQWKIEHRADRSEGAR